MDTICAVETIQKMSAVRISLAFENFHIFYSGYENTFRYVLPFVQRHCKSKKKFSNEQHSVTKNHWTNLKYPLPMFRGRPISTYLFRFYDSNSECLCRRVHINLLTIFNKYSQASISNIE